MDFQPYEEFANSQSFFRIKKGNVIKLKMFLNCFIQLTLKVCKHFPGVSKTGAVGLFYSIFCHPKQFALFMKKKKSPVGKKTLIFEPQSCLYGLNLTFTIPG